jgi:23S rRNA pseudouridine955/2504/2580 synthase
VGEVVIGRNEAGQRLDRFILRIFGRPSKVFVHKMLRKKRILVNGARADGSYMLAVGDVVKFYISLEGQTPKVYPKGDVDIVYEDENVLLANKPAGLLTQPNAPGGDSLIGRVIARFESSKENGFDPVAVNRLDKNTTGLVICAKNLPTAQILSKLLHDRLVSKIYLGVAQGEIREAITLKGFHSKDEAANISCVSLKGDGREAITRIEPIYYNKAKDLTCLKIYLHTGRSHQIRAHLQSIGHPLLGDVKYGGRRAGGRQLLHAYEIGFPLEFLEGQSFKAPLPADMREYFNV